MAQIQNNMAADAAGAQAPRLATEAGAKGRVVILNALPLNALSGTASALGFKAYSSAVGRCL